MKSTPTKGSSHAALGTTERAAYIRECFEMMFDAIRKDINDDKWFAKNVFCDACIGSDSDQIHSISVGGKKIGFIAVANYLSEMAADMDEDSVILPLPLIIGDAPPEIKKEMEEMISEPDFKRRLFRQVVLREIESIMDTSTKKYSSSRKITPKDNDE